MAEPVESPNIEHNNQALSDHKADPVNPNSANLINNENDKNTKNIIAADVPKEIEKTEFDQKTIDQTKTKLTRKPLITVQRRSSFPKNYDFNKYLNGWRSREGSLADTEDEKTDAETIGSAFLQRKLYAN